MKMFSVFDEIPSRANHPPECRSKTLRTDDRGRGLERIGADRFEAPKSAEPRHRVASTMRTQKKPTPAAPAWASVKVVNGRNDAKTTITHRPEFLVERIRTIPSCRHAERKAASTKWEKSFNTMRSDRLSLDNFQRIVVAAVRGDGTWCHDFTSSDRERFATKRLEEVASGESVDADLRNLRTAFNVMEEWNHRPQGSNPFAGRKKATIGTRRKRVKEAAGDGGKKAKLYTRQQILLLLKRADKEAADEPDIWERQRLRALVYFEAYTGARIGEVLHLEWDREIELDGGGVAKELDLDRGVAFLCWKVEHSLKTTGSEAPIGLPDTLIEVLRNWKKQRRCRWVFPNAEYTPWMTGGPGYRPLDHLKELAKRAGIKHATWKMFRHSLTTHGKQWFGLTV